MTVLAGALDATDRLRSTVRSFLTVLDADVVGPMLTEIDLWAHLFERLVIVGPAESTRPTGDAVPFASPSMMRRSRRSPTGKAASSAAR